MRIFRTTDKEPFIAGTGQLEEFHNRLIKLSDPGIFFCRRGHAHLNIDLEGHEIERNTQVILHPGTILNLTEPSPDLEVSYFYFSKTLLQEVSLRLEPSFFRFLHEEPCFTLPDDCTEGISGLMAATEAIYKDREHRFRDIIVRNHLQSFLLDVYDKTHRWFTRKQIEGTNRKDELFKRFIELVHEHCTAQRDVGFYAGELFITSRYLSTIVQEVSGETAKSIIDKHVILEIKALLQSTDLSVQEIANQLQFPDQSFFGRYFKKHTGTSPLSYRRMLG